VNYYVHAVMSEINLILMSKHQGPNNQSCYPDVTKELEFKTMMSGLEIMTKTLTPGSPNQDLDTSALQPMRPQS